MIKPREIAYCGILGAAALLMPVIFHVIHLGSLLMPMYLPLVLLGFYAGPIAAGLTSLIVPVLSGLATGMPPFYPPVALIMALELSFMSSMISLIHRRFLPDRVLPVLVPVLLIGRIINFYLTYMVAILLKLPGVYMTGISFLSGWPGIVLMLVAIPAITQLKKDRIHE